MSIDPESIQEDFVGVSPCDEDLEGIDILIKQLFRYLPSVDTKGLSKILIQLGDLTTLLKVESDDPRAPNQAQNAEPDTVWAVSSCVNLKKLKHVPCIKGLIEVLKEGAIAADHPDFHDLLENMVLDSGVNNDFKIALVVKETLANLPGLAVGPLINQLFEDLTHEAYEDANFSHFLFVSKIVKMKDDQTYFVDQMDEFLQEHNAECFEVKINASKEELTVVFADDKGKEISGVMGRLVFLLSKDDMTKVMEKLNSIDDVQMLVDSMHDHL